MKPKILAIIPARGGSKGIPRKNVKLLAGKPLIGYVIETALGSKFIDKVVVTTDDPVIKQVSEIFGAEVIDRPRDLAEDSVPLDPVVYHAVTSIEKSDKKTFDLVITIQPTSPLLSTKNLNKAIEQMIKGRFDSLISVKPERHLFWVKEGSRIKPFYPERKNRQLLDPVFKETGAVVISQRNIVTEKSRLGKNLSIFEVPEEESVDIDSYEDWLIAQYRLEKLKIVFRVDADQKIGLGHISRASILADNLYPHEITFLLNKSKTLGIDKMKELHFKYVTFETEEEALAIINDIKPNIIINDILDTNKNYIARLKKLATLVVNFEDLGEGSEIADLVVNDMYENTNPEENQVSGYRYVCLRDEFYIWPPKKIKKESSEILLAFGGSDPENLTQKTLQSIEKIGLKNIKITIVVGLGYKFESSLSEYIKKLTSNGFDIELIKNTPLISKYMYGADLAVTSNGRTVYELASLGTPIISMSQNEREMRHLFSYHNKGVINLGLGQNATVAVIADSIRRVFTDYKLRNNMSKKLLDVDLKGGKERVVSLILEKLTEKEGKGSHVHFA